MSQAVDLVKEAGPYLVGLGGLAFGYVNARSPGREARHHTRVEALYQDMLEYLNTESTTAFIRVGILDPTFARDKHDRVPNARVRLYASEPVYKIWQHAIAVIIILKTVGADRLDEDFIATHFDDYNSTEDRLVEAMRLDLGVPRDRRLKPKLQGLARKARTDLRLVRRRMHRQITP